MSDKAEILSDAELDFLLSTEKAEPALPAAPAGDGDQAVTMRGDLEQINLADIFQTLAMSKMEGVLRIRNPLEERQIHCKDGFLRALVPGRLATRRLGQRLVQAGLVQPEHLRMALIDQRKDKKPIGQMLVDAGHVTQEAVDEIVAGQVAEDLFALFTWRHGSFEFYKGEPNAGTRELFAKCPEYEVNSLLLEVARRADEWETILATVDNLDEVPCLLREVGPEEPIGELHRELLPAITGRATYREIADRTTHGLFEVARASRDLMRKDLIANLDEQAMVALAESDAETGQNKRALVLLQTLRDRNDERSMGILQAMAKVLQKAGERKLAGNLLLEAAQRHTDGSIALELAREARALTPHDVGTLSFLRTVLVAHAPADSRELEKCTLDLLDAMVEADQVPSALEIIDDARRTGTVQPAILMREVRARQKAKDVPGATRVLEELALLHDEKGEHQLALEAYENLLRLDRSRKDVQKLVTQRRRTRMGRIVRLLAAVTVLAMVTSMGVVFWQQHEFASSVATAGQEIDALLHAGDRYAAREQLEAWTQRLGPCEAIEDLQNRIAFAESAEAGRQLKLLRAHANSELAVAAEHLAKGELAAALQVYSTLAAEPRVRGEVTEIACSRLDALLTDLGQATKGLQARMPANPNTQLDRQDVLNGLAELHAICRPELLTVFEQLAEMHHKDQLPKFVGGSRLERIGHLIADGVPVFARAKVLALAYAAAVARTEQQRSLDPLFKAAVASERTYDFGKALETYRDLEQRSANDPEMRAHFRDRVARNGTIVRLLDALRAATTAGDFATAQQQLRALRLSFPDVPFDRVAMLPLRIDSRPSGARVLCDGRQIGTTPMLLPRLPADELQLAVESDGFRGATTTVAGDEPDHWFAHLVLPPTHTWQLGSAVDAAPVRSGKSTLVVDRGGNVNALDPEGHSRWTFRTGDLSGLLTTPRLHGDVALVGSLDGDLRALDFATGEPRWAMPGLSTEVTPLLVDKYLVVATTDKRLHCIDVVQRARRQVDLSENTVALLPGRGRLVGVLGENGGLRVVDVETTRTQWQRELAARSAPQACVVQDAIVVADERGHVVAVAADSGDVRWQKDLGDEVLGPPVAVGSDVWIPMRANLQRLDGHSGQVRAVVAPDESEWTGPATGHRDRLIVPVRGGLQVLDLAKGTPLYRIAAGKNARVHTVGAELWVVEADHTVQEFGSLR